MALTTEQVFLEFIVDPSQLQKAQDVLAQTGAIDKKVAQDFKTATTQFNQQTQSLKNVNAAMKPIKSSLESVASTVKNTSQAFLQGIQEGVLDALQEAGVSLEQFGDRLAGTDDKAKVATTSIKAELRGLVEQIAQAKASGNDYGESYEALVKKAGNLKDAIADVNQEIKTAGSDTSTFDGLISGVQGVAGAFAVAQGTAALFGDESEETQKILLKVNAAMAILQGLQSVQNILQKESAVSLLVLNAQQKIYNAQKIIETALESKNIVVRIAATAAQKALNLAMAANPIGIVAVALAGLIALVMDYSRSTQQAARDTAQLAAALSSAGNALNAEIEGFRNSNAKIVADLEKRGALQSEIQQQSLENEKIVNEARLRELAKLRAAQQSATKADVESQKATADRILELEGEVTKFKTEQYVARTKLEKTLQEEALRNYIASVEAQLLTAEAGSQRQIDLQKRLVAARAAEETAADGLLESQRRAILIKAQKDQEAMQAAFDKRSADAQIASIENRLINVEEGTREELDLRLNLLNEQRKSELANVELSEKEQENIREKYRQLRIQANTEYLKRLTTQELQNQISRNNAVIANLKTNDEDRLLLQIANIEAAAAAEVIAANGNAAKIKEIYAQRDADILAKKKQFIEEGVEYEIRLATANNGADIRRLQRLATNEKKGFSIRVDALNQLAAIDNDNVDKRLAGLEDEKKQGLITEKEYNLRYAELQDQRLQITENTEEGIKQLRIQKMQEAMRVIQETAAVLLDTFSAFADFENQRNENRIATMRQALEDAKESGSITEKEAIARSKRIEAEEKKARAAAAQREKQMAIFRGFLAIPEAILKGLALGGPPLAAVFGALAAVQLGLIIARPLPKFGKGKKSNQSYQGFAEVGETGPEFQVHNGQMIYHPKRSVTWVGSKDTILNPKETQALLNRNGHRVDKSELSLLGKETRFDIDYTRIGKEFKKNSRGVVVNIEKDFISEAVNDGLSKNNYFNQRYSFK